MRAPSSSRSRLRGLVVGQPAARALPPSHLQVSLFLANLKGDMNEDDKLLAHMQQYGGVERCFIVRNSMGVSKVGPPALGWLGWGVGKVLPG